MKIRVSGYTNNIGLMNLRKGSVLVILVLAVSLMLSVNNVSAQDTYLELNHPEDMVFTKGQVNNTIEWTPVCNYELIWSITKDDVEVSNGVWYEGKISQSLEDLEVGNYTFTLDVHSNPIYFYPYTACIMLHDSDTVQVAILGSSNPQANTNDLQITSSWILLSSVGLIGLVGVIVAIVFLVKRQPKF